MVTFGPLRSGTWIIVGVGMLLSACAGIDPRANRVLYTQCNMWYEHPQKMFSTNYHAGTILPIGTEIAVTKITYRKIHFRAVGLDFPFCVHFMPQHTASRAGGSESILKFFNRYFSPDNPSAPGGLLSRATEAELRMIKAGKLSVGMSKWAVLRSYGYPPGHRTSLEGNVWTYWVKKFNRIRVTFEDDRVTGVAD